MGLIAYEARCCPSCGQFDTIVAADPPGTGPPLVTWPNGRGVKVHQYRCLACGAADIVKRDYSAAHENDKTIPGQALHADGRMFIARPHEKED